MKKLCIFFVLLLLLGCMTGCTASKPAATEAPAETETPTGTEAPEASVTYTVYCCDTENHAIVEGVVINFCTDTMCTSVTSSEKGEAYFTGPPAEYHVQIIKVPEDWQLKGEEEWVTEPFDQTFRITFEEADK